MKLAAEFVVIWLRMCGKQARVAGSRRRSFHMLLSGCGEARITMMLPDSLVMSWAQAPSLASVALPAIAIQPGHSIEKSRGRLAPFQTGQGPSSGRRYRSSENQWRLTPICVTRGPLLGRWRQRSGLVWAARGSSSDPFKVSRHIAGRTVPSTKP